VILPASGKLHQFLKHIREESARLAPCHLSIPNEGWRLLEEEMTKIGPGPGPADGRVAGDGAVLRGRLSGSGFSGTTRVRRSALSERVL